ncbi:stage III sporulation protein AF [Halobacillus naozhouensis]|uniref:Stage III sporulation protein AF n=1 Tax=Halobacillus naozhouensis TaxID=554880 RepID=A0ABY8IU11_9BACI|nr:stage III sporulation protein AF [Halobacillus naozhouensis]WFT73222.1 stage III sporulation protein AF [Halobacillus naozhouensis]
MAAFTQWITQIVLFLLLAMVADALLPSGSMKKYARLVMSILLVLILLSPLLKVLQIDPQTLVESAEYQLESRSTTEQLAEEIESKKNEIIQGQDAYTLQQVTETISNKMEEPLQVQFDLSLEKVDMTFSEEPHSLESLDKLILYVASTPGQGAVEEVAISITEDEQTLERNQEQEILDMAAGLLGLQNDKIEIRWEENNE